MEPMDRLLAEERRFMFARMAWSASYRDMFDAEETSSQQALQLQPEQHTSSYTRRLMATDSERGHRAAAAVHGRLGDAAACLQRSKNVHIVPFKQAMKAISYLQRSVPTSVWAEERKARRIVGREYAEQLLRAMVSCRPPPAFEVLPPLTITSICFDQTFAQAGGTTGISKYRAIQTVDDEGNPVSRERMVYINGQHFPTPSHFLSLDANDVACGSYVGYFRGHVADFRPPHRSAIAIGYRPRYGHPP